MKLNTTIFHKIVFAHTKFGLIRIKGSGVKVGEGEGGGAANASPV